MKLNLCSGVLVDKTAMSSCSFNILRILIMTLQYQNIDAQWVTWINDGYLGSSYRYQGANLGHICYLFNTSSHILLKSFFFITIANQQTLYNFVPICYFYELMECAHYFKRFFITNSMCTKVLNILYLISVMKLNCQSITLFVQLCILSIN